MVSDALACRSPRTCPTCEHWAGASCALEEQLALLLAPRAPPMLTVPTRVSFASS